MNQILITIQAGTVNPIDMGQGPVEIRKVYLHASPITGKDGDAPTFDPQAAEPIGEATDTWNLFNAPEDALTPNILTLRRIAAWNGITEAESLRLHLLNPTRPYPIS
jgi:hypothetical protein